MVKEKMHLQKNTLFDLDLGGQCPLHLVTYSATKFEVAKLLRAMVKEMHYQENALFDLDPKVKVTRNVSQYPLHHVTYATAKFDVAAFHG